MKVIQKPLDCADSLTIIPDSTLTTLFDVNGKGHTFDEGYKGLFTIRKDIEPLCLVTMCVIKAQGCEKDLEGDFISIVSEGPGIEGPAPGGDLGPPPGYIYEGERPPTEAVLEGESGGEVPLFKIKIANNIRAGWK